MLTVISRAGADYGETEVPSDIKFRRVKQKLESGSAVLIFDDETRCLTLKCDRADVWETETTNIFLADDPILKNLSS